MSYYFHLEILGEFFDPDLSSTFLFFYLIPGLLLPILTISYIYLNAINYPSNSFFSIPLVTVLVQSLIPICLYHYNTSLTNISTPKTILIILLAHPTHYPHVRFI